MHDNYQEIFFPRDMNHLMTIQLLFLNQVNQMPVTGMSRCTPVWFALIKPASISLPYVWIKINFPASGINLTSVERCIQSKQTKLIPL